MTFRGRVQGKTIILDEPTGLPDGTEVVVEAVGGESPAAAGSFLDRFSNFVGSIDDLPEDYALNHEHYRYGTPKREP